MEISLQTDFQLLIFTYPDRQKVGYEFFYTH